MSYLDFPRIHFAGGFEAGPSTINNYPDNYNPSVTNPTKGWNPGGNGYFKLQNCTVTSVVMDMSGPASSSLDNAPVVTTDNWGDANVPAKIVDLDPEQQMVSMLFGLQLKIGDGDNYVIAEMEPMWFQDLIAYASYQSVVTPTEWGQSLEGALAVLHSDNPSLLSIKFMVGPPSFGDNSAMSANIYATIGPAEAAAPINFVPGRLLRPQLQFPFNFSQALVAKDENNNPTRLTIDLGSSAGLLPPGGQTLTVWAKSAKAGSVQLGTVNYSDDMLEQQALVFDIDLTGLSTHQQSIVTTSPLSITRDDGSAVLAEDEQGVYVNATQYVFRMEAESSADVEFYAMRFGVPADMGLSITDESTKVLPRGAPPPPAVGRVGAGGTLVGWICPDTGKRNDFPATINTGSDGRAKLTIAGGNPMNFRQFIDGQVYALKFTANDAPSHPDANSFLSLLVHDEFDLAPTWDNISPIMAQYAKLYPIMASLGISLDDPSSLIANKSSLLKVFGYPIEDPRYMPVVRDLSEAKQAVIVAWLNAQA